MRHIGYFLLAATAALALPSSSNAVGLKNCHSGNGSAEKKIQETWADSVLSSLTLRERIGQLFMVAAYSNRDDMHVREIADLVRKDGVGGLIFFQGGPVRQANLTNYYQSLAEVPLLVGMDAEWGLGMRLDSTFSYPRQMMLGAAQDSALVYEMAADIARQLKRMGVHINFAPVVDINSNPQNPVINTRSFGENVNLVSRYGKAYVSGLQDNGVMACAKHFPGHGDTFEDSHFSLPKVPHSKQQLDSVELYPFKQLISYGVQSIMVGHLRVPAMENDTLLASSLSPAIISGNLISEMGFKGVIFTDALNMKGVADYFSPEDINLKALLAGNDVLLFPSEVSRSIDKIEKMVRRGQIPEEVINIKCRKVLMAKYAAGLSSYKPIEVLNLYSDLNRVSSEVIRRKIISLALTVVHNNNSFIPVKRLDTLRIAYLEIGCNRGDAFREQLELYTAIHTFSIDPSSPAEEFDSLLNILEPYNLVIAGYHATDSRFSMNYGVTNQAANFLFDLAFSRAVVLDIFGSPYAISKFYNPESFRAIIVSYDNSFDAQNLSAQLIFGGRFATGRLPVTASAWYPAGYGVTTINPIRLGYALPEEVGINSLLLKEVDSLANSAIELAVAPGMQILAAKDGVVFYHKSFGKPTYLSSDSVDVRMLYDVASVTKVVATVPSVMRLYDEQALELDNNLGAYLDLKEFPDKSAIRLSDLLRHQSGLKSWIPFNLKTLTTMIPNIPLWQEKLSTDYPFQLGSKQFFSRYTVPNPVFYCDKESRDFPNRCAEGLYSAYFMADTIFSAINRSELSQPGKYVYSDLGFMYLQRVVEGITQTGIDRYCEDKFYSRLGMSYTLFKPLTRFDRDRIVPTEVDLIFRRQLVWGDVHDPAAAMLGGVSGHAGIFSTANDLAKLMQMFLQDGTYGGERFFRPGTVAQFTTAPIEGNSSDNRRSLGFDKPASEGPSPAGSLASSQSFGHTGFTGTTVWADPENGLVYIFLSNRVYPDASNTKLAEMNIRTRIHDVFYRAIGVAK